MGNFDWRRGLAQASQGLREDREQKRAYTRADEQLATELAMSMGLPLPEHLAKKLPYTAQFLKGESLPDIKMKRELEKEEKRLELVLKHEKEKMKFRPKKTETEERYETGEKPDFIYRNLYRRSIDVDEEGNPVESWAQVSSTPWKKITKDDKSGVRKPEIIKAPDGAYLFNHETQELRPIIKFSSNPKEKAEEQRLLDKATELVKMAEKNPAMIDTVKVLMDARGIPFDIGVEQKGLGFIIPKETKVSLTPKSTTTTTAPQETGNTFNDADIQATAASTGRNPAEIKTLLEEQGMTYAPGR